MSTVLPHRSRHSAFLPPGTSLHNDPLAHINRQTKHLEQYLQILIDAQSDGLMAGLTGQRHDDFLSTDSHTPMSSDRGSPRQPSTVPVRQPAGEKIGLRAAREGIFKCIHDLLKLREEERGILASRVAERQDALTEIDEFSSKTAGLEEAIASINDSPENQRSRSLQVEARNLDADIHEMETKLYEMKARHRRVIGEISQIGNSVDAKLSSYKTSLSMLQSDIRKYLQHPPLPPLSTTTDESSFYSLPAKRRTLDMAQEHWSTEQTELQRKQAQVSADLAALEEGGGVWKQVIAEVSGFEKRLKGEMRRSIQTQSQLLKTKGPSGVSAEDSRTSIIEDLENTTHLVEEKLRFAEKRDWKLLICCIAAELQALKEARGLLVRAFNVPGHDHGAAYENRPEESHHDDDEDNEDSRTSPLDVDSPEPPADLLKDSHEHSNEGTPRSEDEDDEPDPAWLLPEG